MPLIINDLGADTQTHTLQRAKKNDFKKPGMHSLWTRVPGLKNCIMRDKSEGYNETKVKAIVRTVNFYQNKIM